MLPIPQVLVFYPIYAYALMMSWALLDNLFYFCTCRVVVGLSLLNELCHVLSPLARQDELVSFRFFASHSCGQVKYLKSWNLVLEMLAPDGVLWFSWSLLCQCKT